VSLDACIPDGPRADHAGLTLHSSVSLLPVTALLFERGPAVEMIAGPRVAVPVGDHINHPNPNAVSSRRQAG
jgi:hypothetical protein